MTKPYHLNVPGEFYREDGCCLICAVALEAAPTLLEFDKDDYYGGCYVKQQPSSKPELEQMIGAMKVTEVDCFRYRGADPEVLSRLKAEGLQRQCDGEADGLASNQESLANLSERRERGSATVVLTKASADGRAKLSIRRFENGEYDFQMFRNDWGATRGDFIPLQVAGYYSSAKEAEMAAMQSEYWLGRR